MKYLLIGLLALAVVPTVEAQYESAYYGLSLGEFDYEVSGGAVADTTSSYRLMVGYQFMEHLTVEGGWGQTSDIKDTVTFDSVVGPPVLADFTSEFQILTIRLLGVLPFDNGFSLLGGLGYADSEEKVTLVNTSDPSDRFEYEVSSNDPTYYVAAQYDWDRFAMRLGYEKYDFDGDLDVVETSLTFFYKL